MRSLHQFKIFRLTTGDRSESYHWIRKDSKLSWKGNISFFVILEELTWHEWNCYFFFFSIIIIALQEKKFLQTRQVVNPESSTSVWRWGHIRFCARPWILIKLLHWTRNLMWLYFSSNFELNNLTSKWIQYTNPQKLNTFVISFNPRKHLNGIVFYWNVDRIPQPRRSVSFYKSFVVYYQKASLKCIFSNEKYVIHMLFGKFKNVHPDSMHCQ